MFYLFTLRCLMMPYSAENLSAQLECGFGPQLWKGSNVRNAEILSRVGRFYQKHHPRLGKAAFRRRPISSKGRGVRRSFRQCADGGEGGPRQPPLGVFLLV